MACMLAAVVCFSAMAVCVKLLGRQMPAHQMILVRSAGTIPVLLWLLLRRGLSPLGNNRRLLALRGGLGLLGMWAYFASISALPLGNAVLLTHTSPVFAALLAWWWLAERPPRALGPATLLCLAGVVLVARPTAAAPLAASAIAFLSAIGNGATYTTVRATARFDHPLVVVLWLPLVCLPVTALLSIGHWVSPTPEQWGLLLAMTVTSIAAQILMTVGMQRESASRSTNMLFLGVLLAMLWGPLLGDPLPGGTELAGGALILAGILALNLGRLRSVALRPG